MQILICDDDEEILGRLKLMIEEGIRTVIGDETATVKAFDSAFSLCDYLEESKTETDAVFMDIALKCEDGIQVACEIIKKHPHVKIIFCTGSSEYAESIFEINPIYMLIKPVTEERIAAVLRKLVSEMESERRKYITLKTVGVIHRIIINDINYIESDGRHIKIHTDDECVDAIDTLPHVYGILGCGFTQCHKSYIVNISKVRKFEASKLLLYNGMEIPVSRSHRSRVREDILTYDG